MPSYWVLINGSGGRSRTRTWFLGRATVRPFGFYTSRYVTADDEVAAADRALRLVKADAEPLTLPDAPWTLSVVEIELADESEVRPVRGFSFFPEQPQ